MALQRMVIPPLGLEPRSRATLLTSAPQLPTDVIVRDGVPRWLGGVSFQALGCNPLTRIASFICGDYFDGSKDGNQMGDVISFDSFTIYDALEGSVVCTDPLRLEGDIQIRMPAMVSEQIAAELMSNTARTFDPLEPDVNPSFANSATVVAGGPYRPADAFALLEQAAADTLHGAQAFLHLTPRGMSVLNFIDQSEAIDNRYVTSQGHVVVADAGYTGPEPDANDDAVVADEWWYVSGSVFWALTQPMPVGLPQEQIDIVHNQFTNIYEAFATVVFDPCGVVAVPVCYESECAGS